MEDTDNPTEAAALTVYVCTMAWSGNYFIPVNDDDDDENGRMDMNNQGALPSNDDDLVAYSLSAESGKPSGDMVNLGVLHDLGALQVWEFQTRTNLLIDDDLDHSEQWPANGANDEPSTVYVEGTRASAGWDSYDPHLRWDRVGGIYGWGLSQSDKWLTVVHVDMDMAAVKDEKPGDPQGETQETTPGGFVPLNDFLGLIVRPVNPNEVEDEDPDAWREMRLSIECSGAGTIEVWNDTEQIDLEDPLSPTSDMTLRVKGTHVSSSLGDVTLCLTHTQTGFQDKIKLTVVKVNVEVEGVPEGDDENPGAYVNVNWDDDDGDGWTPNQTPPNATYAGDKDDSCVPNGDDDFWPVWVYTEPAGLPGNVALTYSGNMKAWETATKKWATGYSSLVPSGTEFAAEESPIPLYIEGVSGSTAFRDAELKATYLPCDAEDSVKVTVFEVDLTGFFGYGDQQSDDERKFSATTPKKTSSDHRGMISWDDANGDGTKGDPDSNCEFFHNCMECQGTVRPSGVTNQVQFDFSREQEQRTWTKFVNGTWDLVSDMTERWTLDDSTDTDEDLTVSGNQHIYSIDGPGFIVKSRASGAGGYDYIALIADFRECVFVTIQGGKFQCSNYYKWHAKAYVEPVSESSPDMTRSAMGSQALGGGWITIPDNP